MQHRLRITALKLLVDGDLSNKWIRMTALNPLINLIVNKNGTTRHYVPPYTMLLIGRTKHQSCTKRTELESNQDSRSSYQSTDNMRSC